MPNPLQISGAQPPKPTRFAAIWHDSFFTGLYTNRSLLRDGNANHLESKFYGPRGEGLTTDSENTEITTKLTIARRPGHSVYNSATWNSPDCFYEFRLFNQNIEQIKVMVDQANGLYDGTGPSTQDLIWTKSAGAGQTYMQYVANTLYFGNGIDQKKWLNTLLTWLPNTSYNLVVDNLDTFIIDPNGNIEQLVNTIFPVTEIGVTGNIVTIYSTANLLNTVEVGEQITITGLTGASFLNATTLTLLTVNTNTATASYTYTGTYGPTADSGLATVLQGGTPVSGGTEPTWNTTLLGTTNDGTAQWRNRGAQIENWGIAAPTSAPSLVVSGASSAWQPNTFYSTSKVIIDSNGNLQQVTTGGLSGHTAPIWATTVGATTTDGTVVWTVLQLQPSLTWTAHTAYSPGHFIVATGGGTPCLFQLAPYTGIQLGSAVNAYLWPLSSSFAGQVALSYPTSNGSASASATGNSLLLNQQTPHSISPAAWTTLNGAGESTGTTIPFPAYTTNYQLSLQTSLVIPKAGQYTFTIAHEDGYFWGFGPGVESVQITEVQVASDVLTITCNETLTNILTTGISGTFSGLTNATFLNTISVTITSVVGNQFTANLGHANYGPTPETSSSALFTVTTGSTPSLISGYNTNGYSQTQTFVMGYPIISAHNGVAPAGQLYTDTLVINFPTAGTYPVEIDYGYWYHSDQQLTIVCNGNNIVPEPSESGSTQPVWPGWTTSLAPAYPSVTESSGNYTWNNLGPASDYQWHALTNFTTAVSIVDPNSNTEAPYRAGVSGTTIPSFATTLNALTLDNPNLTWINQGPATSAPSGTISTYNGGWEYYIALVDTLDDTVSDVGPVSVSTGNFYAGTGVTISGGLPPVIDPQVDYVAIFRTQDGGATWYLIPGDGNTPYTVLLSTYEADGYIDTTQDADLNFEIQAPIDFQNALPPSGIINLTYHLSCIFGSVGNTVYWSTGPNTPVGNGLDGFSPNNYAIFPSLVKRLVPVSFGLFVFTVSDIYLMYGNNTTSSPLTPVPYLADVGLLSYNAMDINGSIIYFMSSDSQCLSLEPSSGLNEVGFPIGDILEQNNATTGQFNPATAYLTWHVSGSRDKAVVLADGVGTWYRMIPTPAPETGLTWCPRATITGGCKVVQSVETAPGVHQLLVGPTGSGPILYRDYNNYSDNGIAYPAYFTMGSIVLAQPGQLAELGFVTTDSINVGKPLTTAVLLDEISGNFSNLTYWDYDPPVLDKKPQSLYSQRFYFSQTKEPDLCRHLQLKISWDTEIAANEILSSTLYGGFRADE
jgi:hypothetical protein